MIRTIDSLLKTFQPDNVEGSLTIPSEETKREYGRRFEGAEAVAAPATVSGEPTASMDHWATGKVADGGDPRARRPTSDRGRADA